MVVLGELFLQHCLVVCFYCLTELLVCMLLLFALFKRSPDVFSRCSLFLIVTCPLYDYTTHKTSQKSDES